MDECDCRFAAVVGCRLIRHAGHKWKSNRKKSTGPPTLVHCHIKWFTIVIQSQTLCYIRMICNSKLKFVHFQKVCPNNHDGCHAVLQTKRWALFYSQSTCTYIVSEFVRNTARLSHLPTGTFFSGFWYEISYKRSDDWQLFFKIILIWRLL